MSIFTHYSKNRYSSLSSDSEIRNFSDESVLSIINRLESRPSVTPQLIVVQPVSTKAGLSSSMKYVYDMNIDGLIALDDDAMLAVAIAISLPRPPMHLTVSQVLDECHSIPPDSAFTWVYDKITMGPGCVTATYNLFRIILNPYRRFNDADRLQCDDALSKIPNGLPQPWQVITDRDSRVVQALTSNEFLSTISSSDLSTFDDIISALNSIITSVSDDPTFMDGRTNRLTGYRLDDIIDLRDRINKHFVKI